MNKLDFINSPFVSYPDYKKFQNILIGASASIKDFINPINFFIPSNTKVQKFDKEKFINSLFSFRAVQVPSFNIVDKHIEKFNRFEDFTKKDEVNNIALWVLSAFKYVSLDDLRLGRELEINQENNPRDGRLDVVAVRDKKTIIIETKTDLRSLLNENRFAYQVAGYTKEGLKYTEKYLSSKKLLVLLVIGGEETDLFPSEHQDCTTGNVGNISKIFFDKIEKENIRFVSANAIWSIVAYKYITNREIDLFNFLEKVFSKPNVLGLLSGGFVTKMNEKLKVEKIDLGLF